MIKTSFSEVDIEAVMDSGSTDCFVSEKVVMKYKQCHLMNQKVSMASVHHSIVVESYNLLDLNLTGHKYKQVNF